MFILKVIDSNKEEFEILKTKSQIEMDRFTTFYENEEELIDDLFFEKGSKVVITQTLSKDKEPVILPFTNINCRNMIYDFGKREYFEKVVNYDIEVLKPFFNNEFLKFDYYRSKFDKEKYIESRFVLSDLRTLVDSNYAEYDKRELRLDLSKYFNNYYSSFKDFYKYITNFYPEKEPIFTDKDVDEHERLIASLRLKFHEPHDEKREYKPYFEDELDSISYNPLADVDDKFSDLDIFLDSKNISEEYKNEIINRHVKKL